LSKGVIEIFRELTLVHPDLRVSACPDGIQYVLLSAIAG
jgi:hypothetical protein